MEDEELVRDFGTALLYRFGYEVVTASNGREALKIYQREGKSISLVILDLIMPEMDGRRCLAEILRIDSNAKVLIASGYPENESETRRLLTGSMGFVRKPYDIRELLRSVRDILDKD